MSENAFLWSITAASNDVADPAVPWPEGMLPGAVNNAARSMMAGIARYIADTNGTITTGGTSSAFTVTSNSGHVALTNGILVTAKASATNAAAATLNLNTIGAKSIRILTGGAEAAIVGGQMVSGGTYQFRYDSAANSAAGGWMLLNPEPDPTTIISTGDIKEMTTDTLPAGFLWCNGAAQSRTTYAALFAVIGTTYGIGDGSTTFNVPDRCGRVGIGSDDMGAITAKGRVTSAVSGIDGTTLGASGGTESITLDGTTIPNHTHTGTSDAGGVDHTHSGTTAAGGVDHTHTVAPGTPSATTGQFSGLISANNGWFGAPSTATTSGASAFSHTHTFTSGGASAFSHTHTFTTAGTGGGAAHRNMQPTIVLNYVIKT